MQYLIILNDPPYGTERSFNALRLALSLRKHEGLELKVFLLADGVSCAKAGQKVPNGYYNLERMLKGLIKHAIPVGACGICMEARGLEEAELMAGVHKSTLEELSDWTVNADKVLVF